MTTDNQRRAGEESLAIRLDDARDIAAALHVLECFDRNATDVESLGESLRHLSSVHVLDAITSESLRQELRGFPSPPMGR